ncbi:ribonuclease H-like domain-containing protein [Tanacetum coccineum]
MKRPHQQMIGLNEYAIRKKIFESKTTEPEANTSKSKTSETIGKTNEVNIEKPKSVHKSVVSQPKINRDNVIIEDWNSDDEDNVSEVNTVSLVKTNEIQTRPKGNYMDHKSKEKGSFILKKFEYVDPKGISKSVDHAVVDSSCSSHMTGNKAYLSDYEDYNGGFVAFGSDPKGGKITGKGKIKTANLDFDNVYFVDELNFKLLNESQVILRVLRKDDVYSLVLKNIVSSGDPLGKFDGKSDEGYLLGYSTTSKAFRVYNKRTKRVEENMHIDFLEDQPNVEGSGTQELYVAEDVIQAAQEKPSKNSPKDNDVQNSKDVAEKEEQHMLTEADQALKDDLEKMVVQEIAAKAMDDATR